MLLNRRAATPPSPPKGQKIKIFYFYENILFLWIFDDF
jgi:hypothetical protein